MILSDELIQDWQLVMSAIKQGGEKNPKFKVKVLKDMHIIINGKWNVICHFINHEYIEAKVSLKDETYLTVRHIRSHAVTANIVLNYINLNQN